MSSQSSNTVTILILGGAVATDKATGQSYYEAKRIARNITLVGLEAHSPHGWYIKNRRHYRVIEETTS